jgi:hypothetical protein
MSFITPSFGGEYIFGIDVVMNTADNPRDEQVNAFMGVNGVEVLDHGSRGRVTNATGRFLCASLAELAAVETRFRQYHNQYAYTLVTTEGIIWYDVKLESFESIPRIGMDSYTGQVWRSYRARFRHLR